MQQICSMYLTVSNTDLWLSCNRSVCDRPVTALIFVYGMDSQQYEIQEDAMCKVDSICCCNVGEERDDDDKVTKQTWLMAVSTCI